MLERWSLRRPIAYSFDKEVEVTGLSVLKTR